MIQLCYSWLAPFAWQYDHETDDKITTDFFPLQGLVNMKMFDERQLSTNVENLILYTRESFIATQAANLQDYLFLQLSVVLKTDELNITKVQEIIKVRG